MNGESGTTTFLPLDSKIGGQVRNDRPSVEKFLTREQADYIYKMTENRGDNQYRCNRAGDKTRGMSWIE